MKRLNGIIGIICLVLIAAAVVFFRRPQPVGQTPTENTPVPNTGSDQPVEQKFVISPIDQDNKRVTKKPFGIYITPQNSPVQPEKFTGYHTGTDFETFPEEANADVPIYAICAGEILQKRTATGYGGLLVQSCSINSQPVTIVYGHVSLKSIAKNIGDSFSQGEKIGNLGQPPSETSGERKHLHLGIHKGTAIDIKGYVQSQSALADWLDFQKL